MSFEYLFIYLNKYLFIYLFCDLLAIILSLEMGGQFECIALWDTLFHAMNHACCILLFLADVAGHSMHTENWCLVCCTLYMLCTLTAAVV